MLCSGHYIHPFVPKFPGLQDGIFKGQVIHSRDYKDGKEFEDKNVVVVGIGNTGADVTVELSRIARQVSALLQARACFHSNPHHTY